MRTLRMRRRGRGMKRANGSIQKILRRCRRNSKCRALAIVMPDGWIEKCGDHLHDTESRFYRIIKTKAFPLCALCLRVISSARNGHGLMGPSSGDVRIKVASAGSK